LALRAKNCREAALRSISAGAYGHFYIVDRVQLWGSSGVKSSQRKTLSILISQIKGLTQEGKNDKNGIKKEAK